MSTDETDIPTFGLSLFSDLDRVAKGLCGHVIDGRFRLEECIGEGGFGWVYRARQVSPDRFVAVKVSKRPAEASARMGREADYQGSLDHPSIVNIIEAGTFETGKGLRRYVAMELVRDGRRIDHYCRDLKLRDRPRINLFLSVCDAVAFAHRKNIIHRDLKPANILVRDDGVPKVIDFGIAKALGAVDDAPPCETSRADGNGLGHTETAGGMGTNGYMSPEQSARGGSIDARTDVFALGRVLEDIFTDDDKRMAGSRLPAWLVPVRVRCNQIDPADRYADAADLAKAIRSRLPLARFHSLKQWPVGLAVAAGVALIMLVTRSDPSPNAPLPPPWPDTQGIELSSVRMLSIDQAGEWSARVDDQGFPIVARVGEPLTVCQRLPGLSTPLAAVAIDPGGTWVAAASVSGPIGLWNLPTVSQHANPRLLKLPEAGGEYRQLVFSNGSRRLFGVDHERRVGAWDLESGGLAGVASLSATDTVATRITSLCCGAGDEQVVVGCSDGTVRSWSVGDSGFSQLPEPHSDGPVFLAGHVRRGLIASVGQDRLVRFRRIRDGRVTAESMRLPGLPRAVTFDGSGESLLLVIRPDNKSTDSLVAIKTRAPTAVLLGRFGDPADRPSTIQRLIAAEGGVLAAIGLDTAGEPKAWIWSSNQPRLASADGLMTEADPAPEL